MSGLLRLEARSSLVLTPRLQQAIKMLQMSRAEIETLVSDSLGENSFLELDKPENDAQIEAGHDHDSLAVGSEIRTSVDNREQDGTVRDRGAQTHNEDTMMDLADRPPGLHAHVEAQLPLVLSEGIDRVVAGALMLHLDPNGWLRSSCSQIAEALTIGVVDVERVLSLIQTIEPAGLFARNLRECLQLQARDRGVLTDPMRIVLDHLPLVAQHRWSELQRRAKISRGELRDLVDLVRSFDPKPGSRFDVSPMIVDIPDARVIIQQNVILVEIDSAHDPALWVNRELYRSARRVGEQGAGRFISEQYQQATWLVRTLKERQQTLKVVLEAIVSRQESFFRRGLRYIVPMVLRDIAQRTELHESTISRVVTNKSIATPWGVVRIKDLFSTRVKAQYGKDHSSAWVKERVRQLIDAESPHMVLSDQSLIRLLADEGILLARRTVAKYRESLGIPCSSQRRQQKQSHL